MRQRLLDSAKLLRAFRDTPRAIGLVWQAHPGYSVALVVVNVVRGLTPLAQLWLTKLIVDAVVAALRSGSSATTAPSVGHRMLLLVGLWALVALFGQVLQPLSTYFQTELSELLTDSITVRLLDKTNRLVDIAFFESPRFYDLLQRAQNEASFRPLSMLQALAFLVQSTISFVSTFAVLLALQPLLAIAVTGLLLPNLIVQFRHGRQGWELANWQTAGVRRMRYFSSLLTSQAFAKEVRLFGLGDFFLDRYRGHFRDFFRARHTLRLRQLIWSLLPAALSTVGAGGAYAYIVLVTLAGKISLGSLTLDVGAVSQVQNSLGGLIWQVASLYESNLFVSHLFEYLDLPESMPLPPPGQARPAPVPLRQGVSFTIRPGETVALVGENGAGKTTVVKLLTRLYDPTEGAILVDGVDLRKLDLTDWRRQVAVIFQDFEHYHMTAGENVGLGRVEQLADHAAIQAAAERGGAAPVIARLPSGLDTTLGRWIAGQDEGVELSGGEWQKIALSRAFMRSGDGSAGAANGPADGTSASEDGGPAPAAQLLILDEPTAALDAQAEEDVYRRFHELTRDRTTLLISHRFATVKLADTILVLEDGRIVERGSHADLMAHDGMYARLYKLQVDRYQ